jgi:hypothetical protein
MCRWTLGKPQEFKETFTFQHRRCYPEGNPGYSSHTSGSLWTLCTSDDGKDDLMYRLFHVYSSAEGVTRNEATGVQSDPNLSAATDQEPSRNGSFEDPLEFLWRDRAARDARREVSDCCFHGSAWNHSGLGVVTHYHNVLEQAFTTAVLEDFCVPPTDLQATLGSLAQSYSMRVQSTLRIGRQRRAAAEPTEALPAAPNPEVAAPASPVAEPAEAVPAEAVPAAPNPEVAAPRGEVSSFVPCMHHSSLAVITNIMPLSLFHSLQNAHGGQSPAFRMPARAIERVEAGAQGRSAARANEALFSPNMARTGIVRGHQAVGSGRPTTIILGYDEAPKPKKERAQKPSMYSVLRRRDTSRLPR